MINLPFTLYTETYIADVQNDVVVILPIPGHQADFALPVGEPELSAKLQFFGRQSHIPPRE